jgi:hypothetical protein
MHVNHQKCPHPYLRNIFEASTTSLAPVILPQTNITTETVSYIQFDWLYLELILVPGYITAQPVKPNEPTVVTGCGSRYVKVRPNQKH